MGKDGITVLRIDVDGTRLGEWLGLTDDESTAEGATAADEREPDPQGPDVEPTPDTGASADEAGEPAPSAVPDTEAAGDEPAAATPATETGPTEFDPDHRAEGVPDADDEDGSRTKRLALVGLALFVALVATVVAVLLARRRGGDDEDEFDGTEFEAAALDESAVEESAADADDGGLRSRLPVDRVPAVGDELPNGDGPRDVRRPANELAPYVGVGVLVAIAALARWSRGEEEDDGTQ